MSGADIAGHVSYALLFAGMLLLSRKESIGWMLRFFGELGWVVIGAALDMSSIWSWGLLFLVMDLYGYWRWNHAPTER